MSETAREVTGLNVTFWHSRQRQWQGRHRQAPSPSWSGRWNSPVD